MDLGDIRKLYAVFTIGLVGRDGYVSKYELTSSVDNSNFSQILRSDNSAVFDGSTSWNVQLRNYFRSPIEARYVRLTVVECSGSASQAPAVSWGILGNPGKK